MSLWSDVLSDEVYDMAKRYLTPNAVTVIASRTVHSDMNLKQTFYPLVQRDSRVKCIVKLYDQRIIRKRDQVLIYCVHKHTT